MRFPTRKVWVALVSFPLAVSACQAPAPTTSSGQPAPAAASLEATRPRPPQLSAKAYTVQSRPFQLPARIWRRGDPTLFPPPEPLPLPRQLLATTGYAVTTVASGALFDVPGDVAFDSEKNAFISNFNWSTNQGGILKLSPSGALSAFHAKPTNSITANDAGTDLLCTSLLFDVPGDVSGLQNYLYTFALPSAVPNFLFDVGQDRGTVPRTPVPLSSITIGTVADAAYDGAGNILIADTDRGHTAIRLLTPDGMVSYVAHVANAFGSSATSLDVGPTGIIYCTVGNQIWQVKPGGVVSVLAGTLSQGFLNGPAAVASFRFPSRVVYGPDGYLYVSDQGNNAIRRVSLDGQVTTIAGDGTAGNTDGVGAAARFNFPLGLRFGPDGNLYVADSFNNLIRKITFPSSLELGVSDPGDPSDRSGAFSPNADGSKDTINLHVTATKNWTLTATDVNGGEATIAAGAGQEEPQTINWDGEVNGITLPDGKYTLRLKAGGQETTIEVILDLTKPVITSIKINGQLTDVAEDVVADFDVQVFDNLSQIVDTSGLSKVEFAPALDGVSPLTSEEGKAFSAPNGPDNPVLTYKVPFTSEGMLLPGKQWIEVEVVDQAGNKTASRLNFTVITNNVPGIQASARQRPRGKYALLHVDEEWSSFYQRKVAEATSQGYTTHKIAVHKLMSRFVATSNWPNFPMLVLRKPGATRLTTESKYVLGSHEFKSIEDFLKRPQFEVVTQNARVPRFVVDLKKWPAFRSADSDSDVASVAFALKASAEEHLNTVEVWAAEPARNGDQDILVAYYSPRGFPVLPPLNPRPEIGRLIHVYATKQRGTNYFAPTRLNIPGRWEVVPVDSRFRAHGDSWPDQASFLFRQWGETARNVMAYKADYQNTNRHAFEENLGPRYFDHVLGEIAPDGFKPYDIFSGFAHENNIDIATQAPRFLDHERTFHYNRHGADFFATTPRDYELKAQRFFIGSRDHWIFADRRNTKYFFEPIFDGDHHDKSPFGIVANNNNIVTFFIPSEKKPGVGMDPRPYWIEQINKSFYRPIFPEDRNKWRQEFPEAGIPG